MAANLTTGDTEFTVAEYVGLAIVSMVHMIHEEGVLTAMMLATPITDVRMAPEMTTLHSGRPRFSTLVAGLLRFPSILNPSTNIDVPRKTKPCSGLSKGQFRAKYVRNRLHSEIMRKIEMTLVMKCDTPSKKKNYMMH